MEESIITPIAIGVLVNAILFLMARYALKRNYLKATHVTLGAAVLVLVSSFIVGSWLGMGIGIISLGMFLCTVVLYILSFTLFRQLNVK